jgi:hypothetical protein
MRDKRYANAMSLLTKALNLILYGVLAPQLLFGSFSAGEDASRLVFRQLDNPMRSDFIRRALQRGQFLHCY